MRFLLKSGAKIEVCPEICKYFGTFFHIRILFCYNQIIILLTALYQQILIIQQIGSCNDLVESRQLFFVQRDTAALYQLTHLAFGRKYSCVVYKQIDRLHTRRQRITGHLELRYTLKYGQQRIFVQFFQRL